MNLKQEVLRQSNQQQGAQQFNQQNPKNNKFTIHLVEKRHQNLLNGDPLNIKISLVGDSQVGKTLILTTYMNQQFGFMCAKCVENNQLLFKADGVQVNLNFCDVADNHQISSSQENTDIFLVIFSVVNENSRNSIIYNWLPKLNKDNLEKIPKFVIGNKVDLRDRIIPKKKVENEKSIFDKQGLKYFECSALNYESLKQIFDEAMKIVLQYRFEQQNKNNLTQKDPSQIIIKKNNTNNIKIIEVPNQQLSVCTHQKHLEDIISQKMFTTKSLICKICNEQINWNFFTKSIDRKQYLFQSIINVQLQELQKKYALYVKACENKECDFFFFLSPSCSIEVPLIYFCPICIQVYKLE